MLFHLKIMLRNLQRGGVYSVINIGGLSIGMAAAALLLVWVYNQWSHDRFHDKSKQIHKLWNRADHNGPVECWDATSLVIGPALKEKYPEIVESVRVSSVSDYYYGEGDRQFSVRTLNVDPSFLTIFSFPLLRGDANNALNDPYSIILTEKAARRLFGDDDPMGQIVNCNTRHTMMVTGVMKDLPHNTIFDFEILGSFQFVETIEMRYGTPAWENNSIHTYVELAAATQLDRLNASIRDIIKENTDNRSKTEVFLYPLDKSYLYGKFENGVPAGGRITFLRLFLIIAGFILLIACINFMNLSVARATVRIKEVGVRKVLGSKRIGLIKLFLSESMMIAFIAGYFAIVFISATLPYFSGWMSGLGGKTLSLGVFGIGFWFFALAFIVFTGLLAGCYPAFYLSAFRPVKVLKGVTSVAGSRVTVRRILVVLQFSVAVFLMIGALTVRRQMIYALNRDTGYDREQLIYIWHTDEIRKHYSAFRNDLITSGDVKDVTQTWAPMTAVFGNTSAVTWRGRDPEDLRWIDIYFADSNWAEMMGVEIVAGRYPNPAIWSTDSSAILLNETAAQMMGFDDPIGEIISFWGYEGRVTGVIRDFVIRSPFEKINPMVIGSEKLGWRNMTHIRLSAGRTEDRIATVESIFKKYESVFPFDYKFIDEEYAAKFNEARSTESLAGFFTLIAIVISCMGLFALTAFTVERRRKEIGIRKVLGASIFDIILLVSKEYIMLTLVAFVIAAPPAWLFMHRYLDSFSYRTNIPLWLIATVGALILLIAVLTVGFRAVKAAIENPVKSIKSE